MKNLIEADDLISGLATVGGIILSARFGDKRATRDAMGNISINVSISGSENPGFNLKSIARWANRPITIAMENGQGEGVTLPLMAPLATSVQM